MVFTRKQNLLLALIPPLAATAIRLLGATLRYRDICAPNTPIGITIPGPTIFAFWHRSLLVCAHRFRNHQIAILISPSFDGELIARTVGLLGFLPVRGSSSRGGALGLRRMAEAYARGHRCAFTADGPRGPALQAKPGPLQLATLCDAKWLGAYEAKPARFWSLKSWDAFRIPKPFTTVTFTWPAHTPPHDLEALQQSLNQAATLYKQKPVISTGA